jgi:CRP-like cAMP-binding protein
VSATIEKVRDVLSSSLEELDSERAKIKSAMDALSPNGKRPAPARASRPRGRRRRRGGTRIDQALKLIGEQPGISAKEIAESMKIKPNYMYRVLGQLEKDKQVVKKGRTYKVPGVKD